MEKFERVFEYKRKERGMMIVLKVLATGLFLGVILALFIAGIIEMRDRDKERRKR